MKKYGVIGIFLIAGCATTGKYETKLQSWVGHSVTELTQGWGVPRNTVTLGDGSKAFEYLSGGPSQAYASTQYNSMTKSYDTDITTYQNYCKTTFFIGSDDLVKSWRWEGNTCRSR